MTLKLKNLISLAQEKGYVVTVRPRLKLIRLHGYKNLSYSEATIYLQELVK